MKQSLFVFCLLLVSLGSLYAKDDPSQSSKESSLVPERILLRKIAKDIESYKEQKMHLILRLQYVDLDSAKASFYDSENINIIFDISSYKENKQYQKSLLHQYRGVEYIVVCVVQDADQDGNISAELLEFYPNILEQLPL